MGHVEVRRRKHAHPTSHERSDRCLCDDRGASQTLLVSGRVEGEGHLLRYRFCILHTKVPLAVRCGDWLGRMTNELGFDEHNEEFLGAQRTTRTGL